MEGILLCMIRLPCGVRWMALCSIKHRLGRETRRRAAHRKTPVVSRSLRVIAEANTIDIRISNN